MPREPVPIEVDDEDIGRHRDRDSTREEEKEFYDEIAGLTIIELPPRMVEDATGVTYHLNERTQDLDYEMETLPQINRVERTRRYVRNEDVSGAGDNQQLQAIERRLGQLLDRLPEQRRRSLFICRFKFISFFVGVTVTAIPAWLAWYDARDRNATEPPTPLPNPPPDITDEQKKIIRSLVDAWRNLPDLKFWEAMAKYVEKYPSSASIQGQILFMIYTIDFAGSNVNVSWTAEEKVTAITSLSDIYRNQGHFADMYRAVPFLTYLDVVDDTRKPIPRAVAAGVCISALALIAADLPT